MNKMIYNKEILTQFKGKDVQVILKKQSKMTLSGKLEIVANKEIKLRFEDYLVSILYENIKSVEIYKRITNGISIKN